MHLAEISADEPSPSPRILRMLARWHPTGNERTWYPHSVDERAILFHEAFHHSEGMPIAERYGEALHYALAEIAIDIAEDELIVGQVGLEDVATTRPADLAAARAYWWARDQEFNRRFPSYPTQMRAGKHGLSFKWYGRNGHAIPAFDMVLAQGLGGLRAAGNNAATAYPTDAPDYAARQAQWTAMGNALDALSDYCRRHASLAKEMEAAETHPARRVELAEIADTCTWIAAEPPRTFREALQLVWFVHLGVEVDDGGIGHSFGRFDQYLWPFLEHDLENGLIDADAARELVACFWIKLNREGDDIAHMSLGGQTAEGEDAANLLTMICFQVERWVNRKQPNLSIRVHPGTPDMVWHEIARTIRCGAGHPAIFNDDVIVPGLVDYGVPVETARDYAEVGCVETFLPGQSAPWTDCYLNLTKCLELALNNGCELLTGTRLGPATGDPAGFSTFDALFAAYEAQVKHALYGILAAKDNCDAIVSDYRPAPLNSAVVRDCLQRGCDATDGGARYLLMGIYGVGLGTTTDSLAAIRTLVYDEGKVTPASLLRAMRDDFRGHERLLALCLHRAPKYGNDDPAADEIAVRIIESYGRQMKAYPARDTARDPHALHYAMMGSVKNHVELGRATAASANGRRAGETLSDGASPSQGCNVRGATATLTSVSKADYRLAPGGAAVNLRLTPHHLEGEEGLTHLVSLLKSYVQMGGEQLQVSVVDSQVLRRAMETPELYRDLVVRVAGFTAYFVTLSPGLQAEIAARAEAGL